jgi:PAS domain S-box-containing protein
MHIGRTKWLAEADGPEDRVSHLTPRGQNGRKRRPRDEPRKAPSGGEELIFITDLQGRRVYANAAHERWCGDNHLTGTANDMSARDRKQVLKAFRAVIASGKPQQVRIRRRLKDGRLRWMESHCHLLQNSRGIATHVLAVTRVIPEREPPAGRVRKPAGGRNQVTDAVFINDWEGRVTFWPPSAERMYGWAATEAVGNELMDCGASPVSPDAEIRRALIETGAWKGEFKHLTKTGREIKVATQRTLLRGPTGEPAAVLNVNTDATGRRRARRE